MCILLYVFNEMVYTLSISFVYPPVAYTYCYLQYQLLSVVYRNTHEIGEVTSTKTIGCTTGVVLNVQ